MGKARPVTLRRVEPGQVLASVRGHELEAWWVDLFNDALGEGLGNHEGDLNPVFAYLIMQNVVDLRTFFDSMAGVHAAGRRLLHAGLEIDSLGTGAIRAGVRYDVEVLVLDVEHKRGKALGTFDLVTIEARVEAPDVAERPISFVVRSRIISAGSKS